MLDSPAPDLSSLGKVAAPHAPRSRPKPRASKKQRAGVTFDNNDAKSDQRPDNLNNYGDHADHDLGHDTGTLPADIFPHSLVDNDVDSLQAPVKYIWLD